MNQVHLILIISSVVGVGITLIGFNYFTLDASSTNDLTSKPNLVRVQQTVSQINYDKIKPRLNPIDIALDSNRNIFLLDAGCDEIYLFNRTGSYLGSFKLTSSQEMNGCIDGLQTSITVDSDGNQYETNYSSNKAYVYDHSGILQFSLNSSGTTNESFSGPWGIALDSSDNIYVVEHLKHRIQVFDNVGNYLFSFGSHGQADGEFRNPSVITIDTSDYIYVVDNNNNRIQIFEPLAE